MGFQVRGVQDLSNQFALMQEKFEMLMGLQIEATIKELQEEVVAATPRATGQGADALARPDAIHISRDSAGNARRAFFGPRTREIRKLARHLFYVEFGTKGYAKGGRRITGMNKKTGRRRYRRVTRASPGRPAQPFFQPAVERVFKRFRQRRVLVQIAAASWAGVRKVRER